jgi:long-chain acyl-CoA synthetase
MLLVHHFLEQSAARSPDKVALVCGERRLTYHEIDAMANRLAHAFQEKGVQRGDRVLLFLPNSVELVIAIFATLKAGGVFVVVNPSTKLDKLSYLARNCRATALVTGVRQLSLVGRVKERATSLKFAVLVGNGAVELAQARDDLLTFDEVQTAFPATPPPQAGDDQNLACLIYTSGSTGEPKGVMSAHSNVVFAASSIISYLENTADDIVINVLPLAFDYGLYQLLMTFKFGGTLVLERSFAYPAQMLKTMDQERVTGFPGVPTIYAILLQMDLSRYDLRSLRYLSNTAAALPPTQIQEIREKFPWATLYSMYGLTETKRTLYLPPDQLDRRPGSVGIAIPGTEVWVEDEAGKRLGPNEIGELVVRGGHVMQGYWESPEASARRFRPDPMTGGRLCYSGDLFRMDEEGFFYFVGRKDDIIKSRGEKVAPKEVETVLYALPGVAEAVVIGVPDPVLGEAIKAIVVGKHGTDLSEREVLQHCRAHLEEFMLPQVVEFRAALPRSSNGKVQKRELA